MSARFFLDHAGPQSQQYQEHPQAFIAPAGQQTGQQEGSFAGKAGQASVQPEAIGQQEEDGQQQGIAVVGRTCTPEEGRPEGRQHEPQQSAQQDDLPGDELFSPPFSPEQEQAEEQQGRMDQRREHRMQPVRGQQQAAGQELADEAAVPLQIFLPLEAQQIGQ